MRHICSLSVVTVGVTMSQWLGSRPVDDRILHRMSSSGMVPDANERSWLISSRTPRCTWSPDHLCLPACPVRCLLIFTITVKYLLRTRYSGLDPLRLCLLGFGGAFMLDLTMFTVDADIISIHSLSSSPDRSPGGWEMHTSRSWVRSSSQALMSF